MLKNLFVLLILLSNLSVCTNVYADSPKIWIQSEGSFISPDVITDGKIELEPRLFGGYEMEKLVSDNPKAVEYAHLYSTNYTYGVVSFFAGVVPTFVLTLVGLGNLDWTTYYISLAGVVGTSILTLHFATNARHYLYAAINEYNGVVRPVKDVCLFQNNAIPFDSKRITVNLFSINF